MDKIQKAINKELESLPKRFHEDFIEMMESAPQTVKSIRKNTEFFLDNIMDELTEEEKKEMFTEL